MDNNNTTVIHEYYENTTMNNTKTKKTRDKIIVAGYTYTNEKAKSRRDLIRKYGGKASFKELFARGL